MKTLITKYLQSKEKTTAAPVLRMIHDVLASFHEFCSEAQPKPAAPASLVDELKKIISLAYRSPECGMPFVVGIGPIEELVEKYARFTPTPDDGGLRDELDKLHRDGVNSNFTCSPCGIVLEIENILRRHPHPAQENKGPKK